MKNLIFEGAGWAQAGSSSDVGNCRIRTRIKNNAGEMVYLEINGFERAGSMPRPFETTGYVMHCYGQDCNESSRWRKLENASFNYTAASLIEWVNKHLGCSFDALEVVNDGRVQVHNTCLSLCDSQPERNEVSL